MTELPLIVILDWDNTIAGNVEYQAGKHYLNSLLKKYNYNVKESINQIPKPFLPNQKLIRPGFSYFIETLSQFYNNNIYFFIYTASEPGWANKEIKWVEQSHKIQFQRPIFTRNDCKRDDNGIYNKSLINIFPRIIRTINRNRINKLSKQDKQDIFNRNILIIDNNDVYNDYRNKLLLCPDYNYTIFENIIEDLPDYALKNMHINNCVSNLINNNKVYPIVKYNNINRILYEKYSWMSKKINSIIMYNKKYLKDNFFPHLTKLIVKNNLSNFNPKIINSIQKIINTKK